jgi:hypothetical protein
MEDFGFCGVCEKFVLRVVNACFEHPFRGAFHEGDVGAMDNIAVDDCHALDVGVEMMFLDMFVANPIFEGLDIFQACDDGGLEEAGFGSKDLKCDLC